jgi:hypothetical protein
VRLPVQLCTVETPHFVSMVVDVLGSRISATQPMDMESRQAVQPRVHDLGEEDELP